MYPSSKKPGVNNRFVNPSKSVPRGTAAHIAIQATSRPVHKAIYKLQCADNITGFTQQSIIGTYNRLAQNLVEGKTPSFHEKFPEKQILDELKANSINLQKTKAEVLENETTRWLLSKKRIKRNLLSEKQVIEFAKNMFLSWDTEGHLSVDRIVGELVGLGLAIDNKIITSLVKTFKGGKSDTVVSVQDFLKFMRGDKISMHISEVLQGIIEEREKCLKQAFAKSAIRERIPAEPAKKSITYKVSETENTAIEIPLEHAEGVKKVLLRTTNAEGEAIVLQYLYDTQGNLVEEIAINQSKEDAKCVLKNFEKSLAPGLERRKICSVPKRSKQTFNKTLEEIHIVQKWWSEIEKKAGCKEEVPINVVADFLVVKGIAANRDKAKQLLGSSYKETKRYVDYVAFKELLYKGVFRNAIKYIYTEVKGQEGEEGKLPEFMQISNYKKKLLMTAFDSTNPQHQQGIQIFNTLKKQRAIKLPTPQALSEAASFNKERMLKQYLEMHSTSAKHAIKASSTLIDNPMEIIKKYKQLISTRPELDELLVYNG